MSNLQKIRKSMISPFFQLIVIIALITALLGFSGTNHIYRFLSVSKPLLDADLLIIEGWVFDWKWLHPQIKKCIESGNYRRILVIGSKKSKFDTQQITETDLDSIQCTNDLLMKNKNQKIIFISSPTENHWTFLSAIYCRNWVKDHLPEIKKINICTIQIHSRKSWIAYKRVFKGYAEVGITPLIMPNHRTRSFQFFHLRTIKWQLYYLVGCIYAQFWPFGLQEKE